MRIQKIICLLFFLATLSTVLIGQPATWNASGISGGGALFSPSISPFDSDELYLACDMTDLFHSTNGGSSWDVVPFQQFTAINESKIQFTADPATRYAVHIDFQVDLRKPRKTTDGGNSWQAINDPTNGELLYLFADPNHTERLLLIDWCNIYYSDNGGNNYSIVYQNCSDNIYPAGVFWDSNNIYIGTNFGLLLSTDNGESFQLANNGGLPANLGFFSFAGAKEDGTTRLIGVAADKADIWPTISGAEFEYFQGIYTMDYTPSASWSANTNALINGDKAFYVAMTPEDIDTAYLGGGNSATSFPVLYKTTDGGLNWQSIFHTTNNQNIVTGWSGYQGDENWWYGEYVLGLAVAPNDPNTVVFTDLGFAHSSKDGGLSWSQLYVDPSSQNPVGSPTPQNRSYISNGLENTSCWWLNWQSETQIFAAYSDITAVRTSDGGNSWSFNFNGNTYNSNYQVVTHPDGTLYAAVSTVHDMYQSTYLKDNVINGGDGAVLYSTDNGQNWQLLHDFNMPVVALALDPNNSEALYASVVHNANGGIYKTGQLSSGNAASWARLANPPRTQGHPFLIHVLEDGTLLCSYSGRRTSAGSFTSSSGIFMSTDDGASWLDRSDPGMYYWTKDIVLDPHDPTQNTWYSCVFSGWGGAPNGLGGIYKTTNRGQSWERIVNSDRVESISIHPSEPHIAYYTTEAEGLWYTDEWGSSNDFQQLEAYTFQHPLRVFFNPYNANEVWITSFGNGLRKGTVGPTSTTETAFREDQIIIAPNPANDQFTIQFSEAVPSIRNFQLTNAQGQVIIARQLNQWGNSIPVDISNLPAGLYFLTVEVNEERVVKKLIKGI